MSPVQATNKKIPFRYGSRQRMQPIASVPIQLGNQASIELPRVGMLSGILLNVSAVVNLSAPGALATEAGFNLLKRIRVSTNLGMANIFDCSGFGTASVNTQMLIEGFNAENGFLYTVPTANGNNNWEFSLFVPIAMNDQLQHGIGLINLQAPEIRCTLDLAFATQGSDVVSNFNTISGTVTAHYIFYEVPDPRRVAYPPVTVVRTLEETQPIFQTGDQIYTLPRGGSLLQLMHITKLNGLNATLAQGFAGQSNLLESGRIVLNKTDTVYEMSGRAQALWEYMDNRIVPANWCWNFLGAGPTRMNDSDFRDVFNTDAISTLESILVVKSGTVIGANASLTSIRRILQTLKRAN